MVSRKQLVFCGVSCFLVGDVSSKPLCQWFGFMEVHVGNSEA